MTTQQNIYRALVEALDALPHQELNKGTFCHLEDRCCAFTALRDHLGNIEEDYRGVIGPVAKHFGMSHNDMWEIVDTNDSATHDGESMHERWLRMRTWAEAKAIEQGA